VILSIASMVWLHRCYLEGDTQEILGRLKRAFPDEHFYPEILYIGGRITNEHGSDPLPEPNHTLLYKTFGDTYTCNTILFGLPGDFGQAETRQNLQAGKLYLDVYLPDVPDSTKSIILMVHGGGWDKGDKSMFRANYYGGLPRRLLERGHVLVGASYRLGCNITVSVEHMLEDLRDVVEFISTNGEHWGGNSDSIVAWGTSAGGHLSLLLGNVQPVPRQLKGIMAFYAPAELRETHLLELVDDSVFATFHSRVFLNATKKIFPDSLSREKFSPTSLITSQSPPTFLLHGVHDALVLIEHSYALEASMIKHNVKHVFLPVAGNHDCDTFVSSICGQTAMVTADLFLKNMVQEVEIN